MMEVAAWLWRLAETLAVEGEVADAEPEVEEVEAPADYKAIVYFLVHSVVSSSFLRLLLERTANFVSFPSARGLCSNRVDRVRLVDCQCASKFFEQVDLYSSIIQIHEGGRACCPAQVSAQRLTSESSRGTDSFSSPS